MVEILEEMHEKQCSDWFLVGTFKCPIRSIQMFFLIQVIRSIQMCSMTVKHQTSNKTIDIKCSTQCSSTPYRAFEYWFFVFLPSHVFEKGRIRVYTMYTICAKKGLRRMSIHLYSVHEAWGISRSHFPSFFLDDWVVAQIISVR